MTPHTITGVVYVASPEIHTTYRFRIIGGIFFTRSRGTRNHRVTRWGQSCNKYHPINCVWIRARKRGKAASGSIPETNVCRKERLN